MRLSLAEAHGETMCLLTFLGSLCFSGEEASSFHQLLKEVPDPHGPTKNQNHCRVEPGRLHNECCVDITPRWQTLETQGNGGLGRGREIKVQGWIPRSEAPRKARL